MVFCKEYLQVTQKAMWTSVLVLMFKGVSFLWQQHMLFNFGIKL